MRPLLALLLASCAAQQSYVWVKPGSTQEGFNVDHFQCLQAAETAVAGNLAIVAPPGSPAYTAILRQKLWVHHSCMQGRGWTLRPQ